MKTNLGSAGCALLLFALNWYIARELFSIEYSRHMASIEAAFISISRYAMENWRDLTWFPLWYGGVPYQNTYPPLLHLIVAAVAGLAGISPALSYHAVTAAFYCLGPVTLFWMAYHLTGLRWWSFAASFLYSVFSPSALLITAVRNDTGGVFHPRRLYDLVEYGEGPHVAAMTLIPVAVVCLDLAFSRRGAIWYVLAAVSSAAVVLTNWLGGAALAAAAISYVLSRSASIAWREWLKALGIGLYAYCLAAVWIPPSTLAVIRTNAQTIGGVYTVTGESWKYVGILLVGLVFLHHWFNRRRLSPALRFFALFSFFMAVITLGAEWWNVFMLPQPHRYHLEMEMGLVPAAIFGLKSVLDRFSISEKAVAVFGFLFFCGWQMQTCRRFALELIGPADIRATTEYKAAVWFDRNMRGERVMAPGNTSFWLNAFTDTPQLGGGFEQGTPNWQNRVALWTIYSGANAGSKDAEISLLWLKAFGVHAVGVGGPHSGEYFKPFRNPKKFETLLQELWRDGDDVIYEVPQRSASLAHVMRPEDIVAREPVHGLDVEPLRPYVAALEDPGLPGAEMTWTSRRKASVVANLRRGYLLSIQVTYHRGWRARVNGERRPVRRDGLGLLVVEPRCEGQCTVELDFDGGLEMQIARVFSWAGMVGGLAWMFLSRRLPAR